MSFDWQNQEIEWIFLIRDEDSSSCTICVFHIDIRESAIISYVRVRARACITRFRRKKETIKKKKHARSAQKFWVFPIIKRVSKRNDRVLWCSEFNHNGQITQELFPLVIGDLLELWKRNELINKRHFRICHGASHLFQWLWIFVFTNGK